MRQHGGMRRIGMLLPSSNTVVESNITAMLGSVPGVSAHVTRLTVKEISLESESERQFQIQTMLDAAGLLADARVHVMGWNGTAASWLGFERDQRLCAMMSQRYGVPATTAVMAVNELLDEMDARRFALVTPYIDSVQADIVSQYHRAGYECVAERHTGEHVNFAFAEVSAEAIEAMIREVAQERPAAIVVMCTNLNAAPLVAKLERELDMPIVDSLAAYVWKSLRLAGVRTDTITGWGRIFQCMGSS